MTNVILLRPKINMPEAMPNPPMGLGYIASLLRKNGHQVHIIDCAIIKKSYSKILSEVSQLKPDLIGITALTAYYPEMIVLSRMLQKLKVPIILGGVHISALPELSLRECKADMAIIGEGEFTTLELINKWEEEDSRKKIKGIAYLENNRFIVNPKRELIQNLDELPFPAWDLINPLNYPLIPHGRMMKRHPVAPVLSTRGCPYSCSYCASCAFWGNKFRRRSPQNVVDEIEFLINKFGIREIHIWDDNFTLVKEHVVGFCREVRKRKLDLTFACPNGVRIDHLNKEILTIMRKTGFWSLTFAVESGSQEILDRANKKLDLRKVPKIAKLAKELGFFLPSYWIFGLPGETYKTARQTIQFAKSLPLDGLAFFIAKPLPGSQIFNEWIKTKTPQEIKNSWAPFYVAENELILSDGKRKLKLPKDAHREYYFRPKQLFTNLKLIIYIFRFRLVLIYLRRFFRLILK